VKVKAFKIHQGVCAIAYCLVHALFLSPIDADAPFASALFLPGQLLYSTRTDTALS